MFDSVTSKRSRWRIFWPEVNDLDGAQEAITLGYGACFALAALNGIVATFGAKSGFLDAALYAILGFAIRRKSRTAAIMAIALLTLEILVSISRVPVVGALTIISFVCLVGSVRGTLAYWRLVRAQQSSAQSPG
jgi:hypothetical protein